MICFRCDQDHSHQAKDFPEGAIVMAEVEIPASDGQVIPIGGVGSVMGHNNDGRAVIDFADDKYPAGHTFHYIDGVISIFDPTDEIMSIKTEIKDSYDSQSKVEQEIDEAQKRLSSLKSQAQYLSEKIQMLNEKLPKLEAAKAAKEKANV